MQDSGARESEFCSKERGQQHWHPPRDLKRLKEIKNCKSDRQANHQ